MCDQRDIINMDSTCVSADDEKKILHRDSRHLDECHCRCRRDRWCRHFFRRQKLQLPRGRKAREFNIACTRGAARVARNTDAATTRILGIR